MRTTASTIDLAGLDGDRVSVTGGQLDELGARLDGRLLRQGDRDWDEAVKIWNGMVAKVPALVVQPESAHDVAAAVGFARERGLLIGVKGGGHNLAGTSIADGGLVLDMSRMRELEVDPDARLARVGPGCLLQDVDRATQEHGLATVLGFLSEVGVAGLTLGGGLGYLARRFGWMVDNLEEVEIVTADGQIRAAHRDENAELFWALRGGGGNFGVVTRFTFRLHEVGPIVHGGLIAWPFDRADEIMDTYRALTAEAPRELAAWLLFIHGPPAPFVPVEWQGEKLCAICICYWRTGYVAELTDELLTSIREIFADGSIPGAELGFLHLEGALNEHPEDDGAVGDARYIMGVNGMWEPDEPRADEYMRWIRAAWERHLPFSTGRTYVNFQSADEGDERVRATYGANYERLAAAKRAYDPDNLFRVNRNVPPAG